MGRVAVIGLGAAIVLTIVMGFAITATARSNLLNARADLIATEVGALPALTPDDRPGSTAFAEFTTAVARRTGLGRARGSARVEAHEGVCRCIQLSDIKILITGIFGPCRNR